MIGILANQKGGVAKTTNTVHLGASLANRNFKTLLIDCDSQCDLSHNVGIDVQESDYTIIDLLSSGNDFQAEERAPNLFVVPGSHDFISNQYPIDALKKSLQRNRKGLTIDSFFDYILIDCPPSKVIAGTGKHNHTEIELALYASDFFMIPLKPDDFSVKNANTFLGKVQNFISLHNLDISFLGFFFSSVLVTENSHEYYKELFHENASGLLLNTFIRQDAEVKRAVQLGKTIFQHKPTCRASIDYLKLTDEFLKLIKNG